MQTSGASLGIFHQMLLHIHVFISWRPERWDSPAHNGSTEYPIHEVSVRINGYGAVDVARLFWEMWNLGGPLPFPFRYVQFPKSYKWIPPPAQSRNGNVSVQVLTTFSCQAAARGSYRQLAPRWFTSEKQKPADGILSLQRGLLVCICL